LTATRESRRLADRNVRNREALERWENEGGATKGAVNAVIR